jgi:hypothetical protein
MNHAQDPDCFGSGVVEKTVPADPELTHVWVVQVFDNRASVGKSLE